MNFLDQVHFFPIPQGTLAWQPTLCRKQKKTRAIFAIFRLYESVLGVDDKTEIVFFLISKGMMPWQPIKVEKLAFFTDQSTCRAAIRKWSAISQF